VVAAFGRQYEVAVADGSLINGFPLGKKSPYAVGDRVELEQTVADQAQIIRHQPRSTLLYRSDAYRQKLIAANATQLILVVATEPGFTDELLSRALVAAEHEGMGVVIVLNKADLVERLAAARVVLAPFIMLGYPILELSAKRDVAALRAHLAGELSVMVGQSGMGKSTLINALIPGAAVVTREISAALDSGKHTTTHARLYDLGHGAAIIDSPGLQEFGLAHLTREEIEYGFVEYRPLLGRCRFRDCRHRDEPNCVVREAVADGTIDARRHAHFLQLAHEAEHKPQLY
jgi:ribosome biogenesis GTPase